jgi:hypothetical protein
MKQSESAASITTEEPLENSNEMGLFFYSKSLSELSCRKSSAQQRDFLGGFQTACASTAFTRFAGEHGLVDATFEMNSSACAGNALHDRFFQACEHLTETATLAVVFHGTHSNNVHAILHNGLDPSRRSGQAYGPGEYFSSDPELSTSYCKGGKQMLVFVVVVPTIWDDKRQCPHNIIVVPTNEHQLPLGVMNFDSVSSAALARSSASRARLQQLSERVLKTSVQASVAKLKARIIQLIIKDQIDLAGEVYERNKDAFCDLSKSEISMYAHRRYDADFVIFYFPSLPEPMTVEERDAAAIKSVEHLEQDLSSAKRQLAQERQQQLTC